MSSSSKAIARGEFSHKKDMFSQCLVLIGCSIECRENSDNIFSFSNASEKAKAQLASTLISMSFEEYSFRIFFINSSSVLKSREPILILTQSKPESIFSLICEIIKLFCPIQINPFIGIEPLLFVKSDLNNN